MALFGGGANAQSELGDMDPSALSSTVVASSSADDNRMAMGSGACTFMSKLVGLSARRISLLWVPDCISGVGASALCDLCTACLASRYLYAIHYALWMDWESQMGMFSMFLHPGCSMQGFYLHPPSMDIEYCLVFASSWKPLPL